MKRMFCKVIFYPFLCSLFVLFCLASPSYAQSLTTAEREAEWQSLKVPSALYGRIVDDEERLSVRLPDSWKRTGERLQFAIPEGGVLNVIIEEIPYGIPLRGYVEALTHGLRNVAGGPDTVIVRKTHIAGTKPAKFSSK